MQGFSQRYYFPENIINELEQSNLSNADQNSKDSNTFSEKQKQQDKFKEKQALNELKFFSEYDELNKSFRPWGDESMIDYKEQQRQNSGNQARYKYDKENINLNQKNSFMNTLNEMSMGLKKLEQGNKCNKNQQEGQISKPAKYQNTFNRGVKQKQNVIEYNFYSGNIISELKKLRDDLQESPDRLAKQKDSNSTTESQKTDTINQKQSSLQEDVQLKDQNFSQRSRSISSTIQRQSSVINSQESIQSFNNPFSNLLGGKEIQHQNSSYISHLKINYENNRIKDKYQTNYTINTQTAIESTLNTPKEQINIQQRSFQNFVIQKRKNRQQSSDFELHKNGFQRDEKRSLIPLNQQLYNSCLDLYDNPVNQINNKINNVKQTQQNQHQRYCSHGNLNEYRIDYLENNQIKQLNNDTLKSYKQTDFRKDKQSYYIYSKQDEEEEEMFNFKKGSQQTLKKSISESFQQNDENITCALSKNSLIEQLNRQSTKKLISDPKETTLNPLINDEFRDSKITEQQHYNIKEYCQRRKVILSELIKFPQQKENILSSSPKLEQSKVSFFEMMKNKIANVTHRATRSQNFSKPQYQQLNASINQITSLSSQVTPKQYNNIFNKRTLQFSRDIQNSNQISASLNSVRDVESQNKNNSNQFYQNNLQQKGRSQNLLQKRYSSIPKKSAKFEEEESIYEQYPSSTMLPKKMIRTQQININESKSKIPLIQLLTKRIQRESVCSINKIPRDSNSTENQFIKQDSCDKNQINKSNTMNIKMPLINQQDSFEQTTERTPKISQMQNITNRQTPNQQVNMQSDNKISLISSQLMQIQAFNTFQKTSKHIREIQRSVPKIPKPNQKLTKPVLLQANQKEINQQII